MNITTADPSEASVLTEIALAAKGHWGYPEHWIAHWRPLLAVSHEFVATHETFAARDDLQILGFSALTHEGELLRLEHLWVRPSAIGHGVGRALFRHAQRRALALGFSAFEIESDPHAAGFYEHMGAEWVHTHTTLRDGEARELPVFCCRTSRVADRNA